MNVLTTLLILLQPIPLEPVRDRCVAIEKNNFYDECGRLVFKQFIFRDTDEIVDWRLVKSGYELLHTPTGPSLIWVDGDKFRRVDAKRYYETWTQHDPELIERDVLPKEDRRELKHW